MSEGLTRTTGDARQWVARLEALVDLGSHRAGAVSREQLWTILERGSDPVQRAAAAVALGSKLDGAGRRRIADLASATASPRLRVVLDEVEQGADEERLAIALDELARGEERARAGRKRDDSAASL